MYVSRCLYFFVYGIGEDAQRYNFFFKWWNENETK